MIYLFSILILLIHGFLHISEAAQCSQLNLTPLDTNDNENYAILIERFSTSNIIKVSLTIKQIVSNTSWFIMGASDSSKIIGTWQPFTSADGEVIDCSSFADQAVTNENVTSEDFNRLQYNFYWMPPYVFNNTITFIASIFEQDTTNDQSTIRYIQSESIQIQEDQASERYQDVSPTFCNSSPCLNNGTCIFDPTYSYCHCVAPWNGVFCNLLYYHIMLASNLSFTSDFYFNTLNSPSYANLTNDLATYLNSALAPLATTESYSVNFVAPSPIGSYISVSMAIVPTPSATTAAIESALATSLVQNGVTPLGLQLSINPLYVSQFLTLDSAPYTSCVFPFALDAIDYNFCIPIAPNFVCSASRVIDRNSTYNSLDCSRNIFNYIPQNPCFPNICLNGGTCTTVNGVATCICPAYFTGSRCDQLYGCNPLTNSQAISCANGATCINNTCICASNATVGTLCEIPTTVCNFPFTYMNVSYSSCAVINGQSLCVVRNSGLNGEFPIAFSRCGAPQCQNNPCGNRGTCQNTVSGSFRCINCDIGYSGYFCELQYKQVQMSFNLTYTPDYQNLSSNASQQLQLLIDQTLNSSLINVTTGGFTPNLVSITRNPDGTTSALVNINTNYVNFLNNATQNALNNVGTVITVVYNTTRACAPWYIYDGRNISGCVLNSFGISICSITTDYDRDQQSTSCSEPINTNLCNALNCGDGVCVVTSRNLTFCECDSGITGANCNQLIQCNDIDCLNNGTCITLTSGYYLCSCAAGFGGTYCQYNITGCVFPFVDNQNRTHNTCITTSDEFSGTIPWCRNALGQPKSCSIDYCAQKPCVYGTCIPTTQWAFGNPYPSFICNCTDGFTGRLCTYAYFRIKALYLVPNMSDTTLNALESPTTQTYQNLTLMFRNLVRNETNSSFDFLPLIFTTFRTPDGNYYQITADISYPGNISVTDVSNILKPILGNLPPQFNATFFNDTRLEPDEIEPLNAASNCTLPYNYDSLSLAVCHIDANGLAYCSYGQSYSLTDRKLCDASGLPTAQYTACDTLNITNPCNSTPDFPIRCVAADVGWTCFCEITQTLGKNCGNLDYCRIGATLCRNNATCVNQPLIQDFSCNCSYPYDGRYCENFGLGYRLILLNYSNSTSPGIPVLTSIINQTIINITNGAVIATSITISPSGEVTLIVSGRNYTIPQFELPLINQINNNLTVGPYLVAINQTNLYPIQTNASCVFPFAYNGVNYTTCITVGYGFPWCSATPVFNGEPLDCRNIDWCASGPCLHNGTCRVNQQLGTFQCNCADGWTGVQCAYPSTTVTIVIPAGNNTNISYVDVSNLFPNNTDIEVIRPGPNNTIIIVIIYNGTTAPNFTLPNIINITVEPTRNINGCVFPFIYKNETYSTCIPIYQNRSTYCCQNSNCDLNPQWQFCNRTNVCNLCAQGAGCSISPTGVISCICPVGFTGLLCDIPVNLCAQYNHSCLNNGVCVINPLTSIPYCNCSSALYNGTRCENFLPCLPLPCLNNGTCSASSTGTFQCNCSNCYSGPLCQITNYCCLNVCSPHGVCLSSGLDNTYQCICQPNYIGTNCSIFNPCITLPCLNNGTCVVNGSNYQCICPAGYSGVNCATTTNPCALSPCRNNGLCLALDNGYLCICTPGFSGVNCEIQINPCLSAPCLNNGTCLQQITNSSLAITGSTLGWVCSCNQTLFSGLQCQIPVSPCPTNPSPCLNNGICYPSANGQSYICNCTYPYTGTNCQQTINPCLSNPCSPNGQCYINIATSGFTCVCINSTYTGLLCQNLTNPCLLSPCLNNSTCIANGTRFICQCPANHTGIYCESILPPCTNTTCYNNGTCLYSTTSVTCLCPPLYTGSQCLQHIDLCTPNPCVHNGTCISLLTNTFTCLCPTMWTGTLCETLINPCLTFLCLSGGSCLLDSSYQPVCSCPPTRTGLYCQNIISPCLSNPCFYNGTCISNDLGTNYVCQCPALYTGSRCENLVNSCSITPCIFGTCYNLNNGSFYCACLPTYTGLICDHPINQCDLSPCVNNGTCSNLGASYVCLCPPNYTGRSCEQIINPCAINPCRTGTCYSTGTSYLCVCDASHTGQLCEITLDSCRSYPCLNNQTCVSTGINSSYSCICTLPYTGPRCSLTILPCTTVVCLNGGTCYETSSLGTQCLCPTGYSGTYCELVINPCQSQPCFNNGTCLSTTSNSFLCICLPNYSGTFCEQYNPCSNYTCLNGGICVIAPLAIGGRTCLCPPAYTGLTCTVPISPCLNSPCVNNGICLVIPNTANFTCICTPTYTGRLCELYVNPCLNYFCGNGGTCYRTIDGSPICSCPATYTGAQCLTQISPCLSSPCLNNGICSSLLPTYNYTCLCPTNYTGHRCENYLGSCSLTVCQNGGTCVYNGLNAISCICPPLWTGTFCAQRIDLCTTSNPCLNSGICISIFNSTNQTTVACQCLAAYTGNYCETPISQCLTIPCVNGQCLLRADGSAICYCNAQWTGASCNTLISPCLSQPCLNNGVCYVSGTSYTCLCPQGYSGLRCQNVSSNLCVLTCANNGTCGIRGQDNVQICICPQGYTGSRCEIQISSCVPSPCLNNGICLTTAFVNGTLGYQCVCTPPYTGVICGNYISVLCGNNSCLNGGTCVMLGSSTICQCPSLFTGTHCENLTNPCDSQPCVNGGTCYPLNLGRKKRQTSIINLGYFCQCPTFYTGLRCESFVTLCGSYPCQHNGTCYQDYISNTIHCLCTSNYTGTFCNSTVNGTNICTINPAVCFNGGTCRVNSSLPQGFSCQCTPTTTGQYCEQPIDDCQRNPSPCINNGTCISTITGHICVCPNGHTGSNCSTVTNPCSSQPCFRNGTCLAIGSQSYICSCPTGYLGTRCEICNCPCSIYPCLNGGVCRSTISGGVVCTCLPGYTGVRCEISLLPCDSNPCLNGGVCLYDPTTLVMTCQCCGLATGRFCEILLNPCNNSIPYCFNGGTCVLDANAAPMCVCPSNYSGLYCEKYSNPCSLVTCIQGTCVMLANSTFLCLCPTGRSGRYCEIVDQCLVTPGIIAPCRNGGTCIPLAGTSYICTCPVGFTGAICDIANPCSSMPCAANATCATLLNGSAICICPPGVTGIRCNRTIPGSFCSSSPCRNNGTCIGTTCLCSNTTSGPTCNLTKTPCPTNAQPTLYCANGGTCVPGYGCYCDVGFGGSDCDTPLLEDCTNSTCVNGGTCVKLFNGTVVCLCPFGYTGQTCGIYISVCSPNPCQNGGTCISGTTGYICICPPNFTGTQCNLVSNPCLYLPCLNNGTCVQQQNGGYNCICLPSFTGTQCQSTLNPCLSTPCNSGTCVTANNGLGYICYCPSPLTGPTCLLANPCGSQPCLNGGTCVSTDGSTYRCLCPTSFLGTNCQTYNLCVSNPCLNNGTCTMLTSSTLSCTCTVTYYGNLCQYLNPCRNPVCIHGICQVNSLSLTAQCACYAGWTGTYCDVFIACLSNPCVYGTCVSSSTSGYACNCITGYYGSQCQSLITQTPCQSNPCHNGGTCQVTTTNIYICICPSYYVGINCDYINPCTIISAPASCQPVLTLSGNYTCSCTSNPCSSNPCQYGTCITTNSSLAYRCYCYSGYLGTQCNLPNPCLQNVCYNGGTCIATVNNASTQVTQTCQCSASQEFVGAYCEHFNPCISSPCLNGATCSYFINISCFFYCTCQSGYTGERCEFTISQIRCESVSLPNICLNGGTCMVVGTGAQCFCTSMYTGTLCENMVNMCSLQLCQNSGTCTVVNGTNITCQCLPTATGTYCEYLLDPCLVAPCSNGGQCIASGLTFSCNCAGTMYTGPRCQTLISSPCSPNPCANGGTCQIVGTSYTCVCPSTYTGTLCTQPINSCLTQQCLNGGTCINYGTYAICNCLPNYIGNLCEYINQCYPTSPCLNGGTCLSLLNSFSCQCPVGRTGATCQFLSDNPCAGGYRCWNNGTCIVLSGTTNASCLCTTGFTGQQCEHVISKTITTTTTLSSSVLTIISESSTSIPIIIGAISLANLNTTTTVAPYLCNDTKLACLAYEDYCLREVEVYNTPIQVYCPRTCKTCCKDYYTDGTCSLEKCGLNPKLEPYCRKTCICKI